MGASIIYLDNYNLWVSNGVKDYFADVVVEGAKLRNIDLSEIVSGEGNNFHIHIPFYGVSGLGIIVEEFFSYFSWKEGFLEHLEYCKCHINTICDSERASRSMFNILCWVEYMLKGGEIEEDRDFCNELPPGT